MHWLSLFVAGLFEIGWPLGFKLSANQKLFGIALAVICMVCSGFFLWYAQKQIPMGTAYAIWTGIGAAGTFLVGVYFFGDALSLGRALGVALILAGVITLKLA
jgi:quaternary ammonium compound-resistance protein SugE